MNKFKRISTLLIALILLFAGLMPNATNVFNKSEAICGDVYGGSFNNPSRNLFREADVLPNVGNRTYTLQEMFSSSLDLTTFKGEGKVDGIFGFIFNERKAGLSANLTGEAKSRVTERGKDVMGPCISAPVSSTLADGVFGLSSKIAGIANAITTGLFDTNFIGDGFLVKMVGGGDPNDPNTRPGDTGIIGILAGGLYYPLLTLAGVSVGIWLVYTGLVKRQIRESFKGLLWVLIVLLIGAFIAVKPNMVAQAPQTAISTVTGCILDGLQGKSCLDKSSTGAKSTFMGLGCLSEAVDDSITTDATLSVNGLGCGIWKAMVLEPWTQAQFGYSFEQLYTKNAPNGENYKLPDGMEAEDFCFNLGSKKSINSLRDEVKSGKNVSLDLDSKKICNVAAYQLYLQSGAVKTTNTMRNRVATVAVTDPVMFDAWGLSRGHLSQAITSLIANIFAVSSLVYIGLKGHIYSFLAVITIAFGPIFALIGMHPGRGRRIFLGWVENLVSLILKYLATAVIVLVTIILFSGLVTTTKGFGTLIASIILAIAIKDYQKEFVNLMSKTNLGGERMASIAEDKMTNAFDKTGETLSHGTSAVTGSIVGAKLAAMANGVSTGKTIGDKLSYYGGAVKDTAIRGLNRSSNKLVQSASRQYTRQNTKIERTMEDEARQEQLLTNQEFAQNEIKAAVGEFTKSSEEVLDQNKKAYNMADKENLYSTTNEENKTDRAVANDKLEVANNIDGSIKQELAIVGVDEYLDKARASFAGEIEKDTVLENAVLDLKNKDISEIEKLIADKTGITRDMYDRAASNPEHPENQQILSAYKRYVDSEAFEEKANEIRQTNLQAFMNQMREHNAEQYKSGIKELRDIKQEAEKTGRDDVDLDKFRDAVQRMSNQNPEKHIPGLDDAFNKYKSVNDDIVNKLAAAKMGIDVSELKDKLKSNDAGFKSEYNKIISDKDFKQDVSNAKLDNSIKFTNDYQKLLNAESNRKFEQINNISVSADTSGLPKYIGETLRENKQNFDNNKKIIEDNIADKFANKIAEEKTGIREADYQKALKGNDEKIIKSFEDAKNSEETKISIAKFRNSKEFAEEVKYERDLNKEQFAIDQKQDFIKMKKLDEDMQKTLEKASKVENQLLFDKTGMTYESFEQTKLDIDAGKPVTGDIAKQFDLYRDLKESPELAMARDATIKNEINNFMSQNKDLLDKDNKLSNDVISTMKEQMEEQILAQKMGMSHTDYLEHKNSQEVIDFKDTHKKEIDELINKYVDDSVKTVLPNSKYTIENLSKVEGSPTQSARQVEERPKVDLILEELKIVDDKDSKILGERKNKLPELNSLDDDM